MQSIDLNCDMGELKDGQERNYDAAIMPYISSCNIACGFHSGTPEIIEQTIRTAIQHEVKIGAHPSYNDRENFGRLSLQVALPSLMAELRYQIGALKAMVESFGHRLNHVKPHGALYNDLLKDDTLARHFVSLVKSIDPQLKIVTLAHSELIEHCKKQAMSYVQEGFVDRRYDTRTQLRSRTYHDAVLHDPQEVIEQLGGFLKNELRLANGQIEPLTIDSICLHSDTPGAVKLSETIYHYLQERKVQIRAVE